MWKEKDVRGTSVFQVDLQEGPPYLLVRVRVSIPPHHLKNLFSGGVCDKNTERVTGRMSELGSPLGGPP